MSIRHGTNKLGTTRLGTLVLAVLAAGAALLFAPAPAAHAAGSSILVSAASTLGSPLSAVAVATCPAGYNLTGAGGRIDFGLGNVVMADVIPVVAAGTVTVTGVEKGPFNGNWRVVAFGICDNVITGVVRVGITTPQNATTSKSVSPQCPAGKSLTGLGWQLVNGQGEVFPDDARPTLTGATLTAFANGGFAANWQFTGYAICATVPAGAVPQVLAAVSALNSISPKSVSTTACPGGTRLVGIGGELTGALGNVVLDQVSADAPATLARTEAREFGGYGNTWELRAYRVCW